MPPDSLWSLIGIPLLIFCARLVDVSLSTLRILLLSRGMRKVAPFVGFFEVLVWLFAISQAMKHLDHWYSYVAYAAGFASGTWLGFFFENRLALGLQSVQIITSEDATDLIESLRAARFGVTDFAARGIRGNVRLILTVIKRKDLGKALDTVRAAHPTAFISIQDVRSVQEGFFPKR